MKIWMVNQYAIPPEQAGITRHFSFAKALVEKGHDVTIIASSFDHVTQRETRLQGRALWKFEMTDGVRFFWLRTPPYKGNSKARMVNMAVFAWRVLRETHRLGKPDVILGSSPHLFGALAARWRAYSLRVPFVLEIRDLWPQSLIDLGNVSEGHPLVHALRVVERHLYSTADQIVTLLPGAVNYIEQRGGKKGRVTWVSNGVSLDDVLPSEGVVEGKSFRVVYAGTHGLANGLDSILDAAKIVCEREQRDVEFVFYGDGPERRRLEARASSENITNLTFMGPVSKNCIYEELVKADAFIVTMRNINLYQHGISFNKLYDYLACARPVVFGSNTPNNPVADVLAGITVEPENAVQMAEGVMALAKATPQERAEMGWRGRRFVEENYSLIALAARLEQVLQTATRRS
ncbi:glycosyltransferase family 4 protein [Deinococcus aestuarii]|uniref:glycosyltransferase family 4 protein n=1 Tax=Deinococcus aestuarii TaxID=2774531 RepID=UPI001C0DD03E|nr:glycosyltransferase family 4 protein [Deinococcus aestuarii]